jgi:hypothetical protein
MIFENIKLSRALCDEKAREIGYDETKTQVRVLAMRLENRGFTLFLLFLQDLMQQSQNITAEPNSTLNLPLLKLLPLEPMSLDIHRYKVVQSTKSRCMSLEL